MQIVWDDRYSVGVESIDNDHKLFFEIADLLGCMEFYEEELVIKCLGTLNEYVHGHFLREEIAMRNANFSKFAEHKLQHDKFKLKITEIMDSYYGGNLTIVEGFSLLVYNWLVGHIEMDDQDFRGVILPEHVDHRSISCLAYESFRSTI